MNKQPDYNQFSPLVPQGLEEGHLRDYMQVMWRRMWVIVVAFFLLLGTVLVETLRMKPVFQASAILEIHKTSEAGVMSLENLFRENLGVGEDKDLNTEVEILKSSPVAEEAARISGHQLVLDRSKPLYERLFKRFKERLKGLTAKEESKQDKLNRALAHEVHEPLWVEALDIQPLDRSFTFKAKFSDDASFRLLDEDNELFAQGILGKPCTTPLFSFTFHGEANPERGVFPLIVRSLSAATEDVQSNLGISPIRNTRLIRLELTSTSPDQAQRLLSSIITAYQHRKIKQKTQMASKALEFIDEHLDAVDERMQEAVGDLKRFKEENQLVSLSESVRVAIDQLAELEKRKQELLMLRQQSRFLLAALEGKHSIDKESLYALGNAMDQPVLISLAMDLSQLQAQRAALRSQYTELHPTIQAMDNKISKLKGKMRAEVGSLVDSMESQQKVLAQEVKVAERRLEKLPEAEKHLADLTRQAKVYQDTYSFMLEKKGELQVTKASQIGDIWVVEPANASPGFIKPRLKRNLLLAVIVGLVVGVGLAFFLEYLDDSVKNAEDIQSLVQLPVLGTIGHQRFTKDKDPSSRGLPIVSDDLESQLAESFRTFRTNLLFASVDRPRQSMVFSSPLPEDGKTSCVANLAIALSQTGKKVLLVDTDLRKPALHRAFHCRRSPGLINVLVEEDWQKALDGAIQPTGIQGLHLLVCGERPPNPNEMLGSDKMGQLIDFVAQRFEFVLFDSPPLLTISDALVLAHRLDGLVLVVRGGKTTRASLKNTVELLSKARTEIMGIVLNDIDFKRERYYYAYHYKYYRKYYGEEGTEGRKVTRRSKAVDKKKG
jgi:tyrosine-protein kinase Etk/Wzc